MGHVVRSPERQNLQFAASVCPLINPRLLAPEHLGWMTLPTHCPATSLNIHGASRWIAPLASNFVGAFFVLILRAACQLHQFRESMGDHLTSPTSERRSTANSPRGATGRRHLDKRKRMGIEPTKRSFERFTGFENRDGHQTRKRFQNAMRPASLRSPRHARRSAACRAR